MNNCRCGGEAIVEDGFIDEINSSGKFVCCMECDNKTSVFPDFAESAAIQDWDNEIYDRS